MKYSVLSPGTWRSTLNIKGNKREVQKRNAQTYVDTKYQI